MYIERKFPFKGMMKWTRRDIYKFIVIGAIPVFMYKGLGPLLASPAVATDRSCGNSRCLYRKFQKQCILR